MEDWIGGTCAGIEDHLLAIGGFDWKCYVEIFAEDEWRIEVYVEIGICIFYCLLVVYIHFDEGGISFNVIDVEIGRNEVDALRHILFAD